MLTFTKHHKLICSQHYKNVFENAKSVKVPGFLLLFTANQGNNARLGLVVAKRNIKSAVGRNHVKRLVRESFRLQQAVRSTAYDVVVIAQRDLINQSNQDIFSNLDRLWQKLLSSVGKSQSSP